MTVPYHPYQLEGATWLRARSTALLADEMGLGKSLQVILAAQDLHPPWPERMLIVCPAIVREHWRREIVEWARIPPHPITIPQSLRDPPGSGTTICSYEWATKNHARLPATDWDIVVLDEAHHIKNPRTRRARALLGALSERAERLWMLTGTPAPNHPGELWIFARIAGVTGLSQESFCRRYTYGEWRGHRWQALATHNDRMPELQAAMAPTMLRRTKAEVMTQLPPLSRHLVPLPLPRPDSVALTSQFGWGDRLRTLRSQLQEEAGIVRSFLERLGEDQLGAYETLAGVAQYVPTLRRYLGLLKVRPAVELLCEELEADPARKVVVFCSHVEVGQWLTEALVPFRPVWVYGACSPGARQASIDSFNQDPRVRVLVGNIQACGSGINLAHSGCSNAVFVEREWTPMWGEQAEARLHRPPQSLPVTVRDLIFPGTLDEAITAVLTRKRIMISKIFQKELEPEFMVGLP